MATKKYIGKKSEKHRRLNMWQFMCDSIYDLFHLEENRYTGLEDWWTTRKFEWDCLHYGSEEALNRQEDRLKDNAQET